MFLRLKQRLHDMRTIRQLCTCAEQHANADGQKEPGSEHFILAALDLPDGSARKAFETIGADPGHFRQAIAEQYGDALRSVGVDPAPVAQAPVVAPDPAGLYRARTSAQALMQQLASLRQGRQGVPLMGAHIIAACAAFQHGVAARALRRMGVDIEALANAARVEIAG
jgi:ATP-dependent Clp protease ATP-binding subunit ClpA